MGRSGGFNRRCFFVDVKSLCQCYLYIYIMYTICSIFADIRCCVQMMLYMTDCIFMIIHL